MMRSSTNRRTATKVKDGRVQRKNRRQLTGHQGYVIDRESPGRGCIHVVSKRDVQTFIDLIPDWPRYSERLERIVLTRPDPRADGSCEFWHRSESSAIYLSAWEEDLWLEFTGFAYFDAHESLFLRLGVACERKEDSVFCRFTPAQARAFVLLHVFLHELGHHYDFIHQKHLGRSKGEDYAEQFATSRFEQLFPAYIEAFGDPRTGG